MSLKKTMHVLKLSLFFFSILSIHLSFSQTKETYFHELEIQGNPFNKKVNVLFEDSIGYLWIGTKSGLFRYDGYNVVSYQYNVFDPNSIPNNTINSIVEDSNKNLWIGSESFLIYFNRKENKFKGFYKNITSIVLNKTTNGNIWANARNTGLVKIEPNENIDKIGLDSHFNYDSPNLLKFNRQISAMVEDHFGRHWIGTPRGIFILNKKNEYIKTNFGKTIRALKLFGNNQFLVATNKGIFVLSYNKTNNNLEIMEYHENIMAPYGLNGNITSIAFNTNRNELWIGSTQGLFKATKINNSYEFSYISEGDKKGDLLSNQINDLVLDSYNNLWIGSSKGVNKQLGRNSIFEFNKFKKDNGFNNAQTNCILNIAANNILLGKTNGLFKYNVKKQAYTKIKLPFEFIVNVSYNYEQDKLLIANYNVLYESEPYKLNKNKLVLTPIDTCNAVINGVAVINKNEICLGVWGKGIKIINKENELSHFKKQVVKKLENAHTSVLLLSSENELWIGTRGEGLFKINFNNETIDEYLPELPKKEGGLTANAILCLYEDAQGLIWIGTRGGGLNQYVKSSNNFIQFTKQNNTIPDATIAAIQEDNEGNIWMSTNSGISRLDKITNKIIPFGFEDGVEESEFSFNSSAANTNKSELYFGTTNGFYTLHTKEFSQKDIIPSTVITSFSTLGATKNNTLNNEVKEESSSLNISSDSLLILPHNKNNIVVNFSSLDLTAPNKNQYAYMLEGLNDYWIYTNASNRNANYNDLSPGTYTFKVKSSNSDGIWNETPTVLKFKITPPIWKSNWAIFAYWLLLGVIVYSSYILISRWYKLKKNLVKETISREKDNEHNRMKMVFFTDISHELRTPLTLILGTIEKIVKEKKFTLSPLTAQRIYNNSIRMNRLISQIMDIRKFDVGSFKIKVSKNNIIDDIKKIKNAFNDFAKIYHIRYEFTTKTNEIQAYYDTEILEKILFNLLSNAFKYTPEKGNITVKVDNEISKNITLDNINLKHGNFIKCSVRDSGVGISKKDIKFIFDRYYQSTKLPSNQVPGTGIGMELVQKLIEIHHGAITVKSEENNFTEFTFYLPIDKSNYKKKEIRKDEDVVTKTSIKESEYSVIEDVSINQLTEQKTNKKSKPVIIIIEDNKEVRTMLKEELTDLFHVLEATNGKEGYDTILKEKPNLIISDILMPLEDGISMLKRIKENKDINNIPIFMLTAKNSDETKIECLSLGADDYIEKPFSLEYVKWKVKNTLITRKELKEKFSKVITAEPSEIHVDSNNEKFIKKLIKIIENSMDDNLLSVEYLASEVGMSRANLYRKLQAILNDTPVNFIKTIRLKRAAQLLKKNTMYISEVAYMTGFNNQKYFGKCFSKEYGMSPTEYIKKHADEAYEDKIGLR